MAVVTGGGSGIGRAAALLLAREGARVVVADVRPEAGAAAASEICGAGGEALAVAADVARGADAEAVMARAAERYGGLDILVNNAGIPMRKPVAEQDEEGWDEALRVNLRSVYLCSKHAIPYMLRRGGSIVNMSSVTGIVGVRNRAVYSATKGAIAILTKNMALDYARHNIRVNCVCPGFTRTPLIEKLMEDPEKARTLVGLHPL